MPQIHFSRFCFRTESAICHSSKRRSFPSFIYNHSPSHSHITYHTFDLNNVPHSTFTLPFFYKSINTFAAMVSPRLCVGLTHANSMEQNPVTNQPVKETRMRSDSFGSLGPRVPYNTRATPSLATSVKSLAPSEVDFHWNALPPRSFSPIQHNNDTGELASLD